MNKLLTASEIALGGMILTLPISSFPRRYRLPALGGNLPSIFLLMAIIFFCIYIIKNRRTGFYKDKYFGIFFLWSLFCLAWGCWQLPYYSAPVDNFLRNSRMVTILSGIVPELKYNTSLLHIKMFFSLLWSMIKNFFFPFIGMAFIISEIYRKHDIVNLKRYLYWGIYGLSILMVLYSIPEIIWLWTGNETCEWILSSINWHLYDPAGSNDWWPPLLWKGQLRSICLEPSYFGIINAFLIPFLAIDIHREDKFKLLKILLIFFLIFMMFMTKARTATVVYLGECLFFVLISIYFRYSNWKKMIAICLGLTIGSFSLCILGDSFANYEKNIQSLTENYVENNITSVIGQNKRSNSARLGNTLALIKIGEDYPITGVGMELHSPYMKSRIPDFAKDNGEIKKWIQDMEEKSFLGSDLPILNEYAAFFAWEGIPGLMLFIFPILIIFKRVILETRKYRDFESIGLLTALVGQLACMFSAGMFLIYPLTLWLVYFKFEQKDLNT